MGLFKRGQTWWISFSHNGKQVRHSTETGNEELAKKIYYKVMTEVAEGKWLDKLPGSKETFKEMMEKYMDEHSKPNKASWDRDERSLAHLLPFFQDHVVTEVKPKMINQYKTMRRKEGASTCSVNRELALMKHAYTLAIKEWEWARENPVKMVKMEKEPPSRDRWLNYEEEKSLLAVSPQWLTEIITFAVETGCRKNEILSLIWRDVNLTKKVVTIFGQKTGERRELPLSQFAYDVLFAKHKQREKIQSLNQDFVFSYPTGQKLSVHTLRTAYENALTKAKKKGSGFTIFATPLQPGCHSQGLTLIQFRRLWDTNHSQQRSVMPTIIRKV